MKYVATMQVVAVANDHDEANVDLKVNVYFDPPFLPGAGSPIQEMLNRMCLEAGIAMARAVAEAPDAAPPAAPALKLVIPGIDDKPL